MSPQIRIYDMDKSILDEREPGAPAHAKIAAAVMRAYDLLAAGDGPQTPEEWEAVTMQLTTAGIACEMASADQEKERAARPNPRMVDGRGRCSCECPLFSRQSSPDVGWCKHTPAGEPTRDGAYCGVWVDQRLDEHDKFESEWKQALREARQRALRDAGQQAEIPAARPPGVYGGDDYERECEACKLFTRRRTPDGHVRCAEHGGLLRSAACPSARPVDANTAAIIVETERRAKSCKCGGEFRRHGGWNVCSSCEQAHRAKGGEP
jgi:hypothetical protein